MQRKLAVTSVLKFILKSRNYACIRTIIIFTFYEPPNKANYSPKRTFFLGITTLFLFLLNLLLCGSRILKKIIHFFGLRFRYHRLANKEKLSLPLGNFFKTLKDMVICTAGT